MRSKSDNHVVLSDYAKTEAWRVADTDRNEMNSGPSVIRNSDASTDRDGE
jgi:hypothetical protein